VCYGIRPDSGLENGMFIQRKVDKDFHADVDKCYTVIIFGYLRSAYLVENKIQ
jgi:hypothetical protein